MVWCGRQTGDPRTSAFCVPVLRDPLLSVGWISEAHT